MNNLKRIPRPMGLTELGRKFNITNNPEDKINLRQHFIRSYIINNFRYNGRLMTMQEFCIMGQVTESEVMQSLLESNENTVQRWDEYGRTERGMSIIREISERAFKGILESQVAVGRQQELLLKSQGDGYKPWISSEVGKVLKLGMEQTQMLMAFAKSLQPQGNQGSSFIPYSPYQEVPLGTITIDDVTQAFKDNNIIPLVESETKLNALKDKYNIESLPEVNALMQYDYDASKEGLSLNNLTKLPQDEELPKHINRRAKELNIDLEADQV